VFDVTETAHDAMGITVITNIIVVVPCNPDLKRENNKMVKRIFIFLTLNE